MIFQKLPVSAMSAKVLLTETMSLGKTVNIYRLIEFDACPLVRPFCNAMMMSLRDDEIKVYNFSSRDLSHVQLSVASSH